MNIEIQKTETINITFPMYVESLTGQHKYAILSEDNVISVHSSSLSNDKSVKKVGINVAFYGGHRKITEKEFCDKYKEVATKIYDDCDNFLNGVEDRRHEILSTPLPDHDYGDEQNIEFDRFMSKQNDYYERQNDAHVFREPGDSFY